MFGWKELGAGWPTEQAYQVLELLRDNRIRCRLPGGDMFINAFDLPHPALRWSIKVRRRDVERAWALLAREGLARGQLGAILSAEEPPAGDGRPDVRPLPSLEWNAGDGSLC